MRSIHKSHPTRCESGLTGDGVLCYARLEPRLIQLIAGRVDGHARLEVVHTAEHQIHRAISQAARPGYMTTGHMSSQNETSPALSDWSNGAVKCVKCGKEMRLVVLEC